MLPWKLVTEFDKEKHLFSDIVKTNYVVNTFICSCGYIEFIVADASQTIDYTCQMCGNYDFYDANLAIKNLDLFLYLNSYIDLDYKYETNIKKDIIISSFVAHIPQSIDYSNKKVHFKSKSAYDFKLYYNGKVEKDEHVGTTDIQEVPYLEDEISYKESYYYNNMFKDFIKLSEKIFVNLKNNLIKYLNTNYKQLDIPKSEKVKLDIEKASFFFQHRHLKDLDFYYWLDLQYIPNDTDLHIDSALKIILNNKKEKSIKKALFNNYKYQLEKHGYYATYLVMQFIKKIEDANILTKLLRLDIYHLNIEKYYVEVFLDFLLLRYTQKQIYSLFVELANSSNDKVNLFNDLLMQLNNFTSIEEFDREAGKIKCNIDDLHDSITSYYYDKEQKNYMTGKSIDILEDDLKPCGQIEDYEVKLPKSGDELYQWAGKLQNCMASYFKSIQNKDTIIYCFFKDNKIEFAVEIIDKKIIQARAVRNILLNDEQNNVLKKWFKRYFNPNDSFIKKEHNISANIALDE